MDLPCKGEYDEHTYACQRACAQSAECLVDTFSKKSLDELPEHLVSRLMKVRFAADRRLRELQDETE